MCGLATTRNDDAGAGLRAVRSRLHSGRQVHEAGDGADHTLGMVDQTDKLTQRGPPPEVNDPLQARMVMPGSPNLDELDSAAKMINNLLRAFGLPPFDGDVVLAAGVDDPERRVGGGQFVHLGVPRFFDV